MDVKYESIMISNAKQGDEEAWAVLFKWNFDSVYSFCLQSARGRHNDAEEITQQTFVVAAKRICNFVPSKGTFRMWLFGIAKNCIKKYWSQRTLPICDSGNTVIEAVADSANKFSENMIVLEALAQLPSHYSAVLESKYLYRKTLTELAEEYQITVAAVGSRLARARERFKQVYQNLLKQE